MVLTILLPGTQRVGPQWLFPLIEGLLLVALIAGDPGKINRRSRWLRVLSIALVSVLVLGALWATAQLIDDLIHGGPETNSASELLETGAIVWVSNNIAFALLYWELDDGGAPATCPPPPGPPRFRVPSATEPADRASRLAAPVRRLPVPRLHERDRLQPDRRHAARALGEDRDGGAVSHLAQRPLARRCASREHFQLAVARRVRGEVTGLVLRHRGSAEAAEQGRAVLPRPESHP